MVKKVMGESKANAKMINKLRQRGDFEEGVGEMVKRFEEYILLIYEFLKEVMDIK